MGGVVFWERQAALVKKLFSTSSHTPNIFSISDYGFLSFYSSFIISVSKISQVRIKPRNL